MTMLKCFDRPNKIHKNLNIPTAVSPQLNLKTLQKIPNNNNLKKNISILVFIQLQPHNCVMI